MFMGKYVNSSWQSLILRIFYTTLKVVPPNLLTNIIIQEVVHTLLTMIFFLKASQVGETCGTGRSISELHVS